MAKRQAGDVTEVGTIVSEKPAFENRFFGVIERVVKTPDGETREPQLLWDRQGKVFAVAVAITADGEYVLVEEPKYGQMFRMISAPTGGVKKGEDPLDAARREFLEETGYTSSHWTPLTESPIIDFADKSDGGNHLFFLATGAKKIREPADPKQIVVLAGRQTLIEELLPSGRIPAMSMAALLLSLHSH